MSLAITVEEWEAGRKLPDDLFQPVFVYSDLAIIRWLAGRPLVGRLVKYVGRETGLELSAGFADVLERAEL